MSQNNEEIRQPLSSFTKSALPFSSINTDETNNFSKPIPEELVHSPEYNSPEYIF